ncbi:TolB family protein [Sphingomonas alpina]|uniref:PD40 domain-containing protein n=1 Tax=Sphingomonas alpina TaxID=653931 RepID=A0A7H0LN34_9SPHN|nr:PD40 domain-containing protein [Sphingomonas alpina]QNQ11087.1 PD40 domain-containing protein [Sphingomonas alpina]
MLPIANAPRTPRHWTPPAISTDDYESTPTFSPDGRELLYLSADRSFARWRLLMSRCIDGRWSSPAPPPFAAPTPVIEADPGYTPDGKGLYFLSARHDPANEDFDIWYVERHADGNWGQPRRLPSPVNSPHAELLPRADLAGRLYFGSSRLGGHGQGDIYVAERDRQGSWQVRNAGPPISTAANEYEAEISRDGRTMIVVADRGDRSHLYRFVRDGSTWRETGRVPTDLTVFQVGPLLSPDARSLLFAQADQKRSGEIFQADLQPDGARGWPKPCENQGREQ